MVTVCHTGRRAGRQGASCAPHYSTDDWNQLRGGVAETHTLTHLLSLLPVSLLSLVPAEQWRDDLSLSGTKKDKYEPKKRVEGSRKEREAGAKERQHL